MEWSHPLSYLPLAPVLFDACFYENGRHQMILMSSISLIPVIATWVSPRSGVFDETANICRVTTFSGLVVIAMDLYAFLAICFLW